MGNKSSLAVKRRLNRVLPASMTLNKLPQDSRLLQATRFTRAELESLHHAFLYDCPNGFLTRQQFKSMYSTFFPRAALSEKFAEHLFRSFDIGGDGLLDFGEFALAMSITQRGSQKEKMEWIFRFYDVNGDGKITEGELTEVVEALTLLEKCELYKPSPSSGGCMACDISIQEKTGKLRAVELFDDLDTNGDGVVTREEFFAGVCRDPNLINLLSST